MPSVSALLVQVIARDLEDDRTQQCQGDQVGDCHEPVHDICQQPDQFKLDDRPGQDGDDPQDPVRHDDTRPEDELGTAFAVIAPAQKGGEGKYDQAECDDVVPAADSLAIGKSGQGRTRLSAGPGARQQDDQCRHGADDERVDEGAEHADQALAHRVVCLGRRMRNRGATEACLVGKHSPRDAETNRCPDRCPCKTARRGCTAEGAGKNQFKRFPDIHEVRKMTMSEPSM